MQDKPDLRSEFWDSDRKNYLILGIGIAMGILLMILLGAGLYTFDLLHVGELATPDLSRICPATPDLAVVCPTREPTTTQITCPPTATLPPPTPTTDVGATATVACATHEAQFPGTPCP